MNIWRSTEVLTDGEMSLIHNTALKMLAEVGGIVQNRIILEKLEEYGARVDYPNEKAYFPQDLMERFLAESEPLSEEFDPKEFHISAGTYGAFWMTPEGNVERFTEKSILDYFKLCANLENVDSFSAPIPADMGPAELTPLYMRLLAWKYIEPSGPGSGQVQNHRLIPYVIQMGQVMADHFGGEVKNYIYGDIEFQSPFRCSCEEAAILVGLWEKGYHCGIGGPMPMAGATAPVTLAGILTQHIAETLFRLLISRVMYPERSTTLNFGSGLGLMDMKTGIFSRSRPETVLLHLALGQIVHKVYKGWFRGHSFGVTDAQTPSLQAGFENAMNVFTGLLAGNRNMGGLGVICQPTSIISALQMILDNECVGLVKRFIRGFEITEETIALDVLKEVGAGGIFVDTMHTAKNYRKELWTPAVFNQLTYQSWEAGGKKTELDTARDIYYEIMKKEDIAPKINERVERDLREIIQNAQKCCICAQLIAASA